MGEIDVQKMSVLDGLMLVLAAFPAWAYTSAFNARQTDAAATSNGPAAKSATRTPITLLADRTCLTSACGKNLS